MATTTGSSPRRHGVGLCLSGGGYRAALFHLGALRRLDELGVLAQVRTISAVSGGAIIANLLADPRLVWPERPARPRSCPAGPPRAPTEGEAHDPDGPGSAHQPRLQDGRVQGLDAIESRPPAGSSVMRALASSSSARIWSARGLRISPASVRRTVRPSALQERLP